MVVPAGHELGEGMHDDSAPYQSAERVWCRDRIVDDERNAWACATLASASMSQDVSGRVAARSRKYRLGLLVISRAIVSGWSDRRNAPAPPGWEYMCEKVCVVP